MELRQFIKATLGDIYAAAKESAEACPGFVVTGGVKMSTRAVESGRSPVQTVDFEVTVSADETAGSEAKVNVLPRLFGGGVTGNSSQSGGHAATLRFSVPVDFTACNPGGKVEESKASPKVKKGAGFVTRSAQ